MKNRSKPIADTVRVLFLSTSYPRDITDWRGIFMRHLVGALSRAANIQLALWAPPGELPVEAKSVATQHELDWLGKLMSAGGISHLMRDGGIKTALAPFQLLRLLRNIYTRHHQMDVYHINWLQCAIPLPNNAKPALITVLGNDLKLMRLPFMRSLLRRVMKKRKIALCPNAEWMQVPLITAFGDVAEIIPVSFGIDPCWFAIKRELNLHKPKRWIAVTRLTADKLGPLFAWSGDFFRDTDRELHLFGPMQEKLEVPQWVRYHGTATPEQLVADWFPSACGLITLSCHAEGRPQVMLEAMAAALPIIASRMPAHAGIVNDGVTGVLCDSMKGYGAALLQLENPETNRRFGEAARDWTLREVGTWDDCAYRYTHIYRRLLGDDRIE